MRRLRILLLAGIPAAWGQAMVEYGLGTAAAGTGGAGVSAGKGISGVFSNLAKTLNSITEAQPAAASTAQPTRAAAAKAKPGTAQPAIAAATTPVAAPPKPAVVYEDPTGIKAGMEQSELLSRFGEPAMKVTSGASSESLTYETRDCVVDVEMRAGKVYSVRIINKTRQSAVVLLQ